MSFHQLADFRCYPRISFFSYYGTVLSCIEIIFNFIQNLNPKDFLICHLKIKIDIEMHSTALEDKNVLQIKMVNKCC